MIGGLPLGLLVSAGATAPSRISWLDLAITTLVCAAAIGVSLAGVAHLFATRVRRRPLTIVLFVVAMVVSGVGVSGAVYLGAAWVPHGRWERLPLPPEPLAELTGPDCYYAMYAELFALAQSGNVYRLAEDSASQSWERSDGVPTIPPREFQHCLRRLPESSLRSSWAPRHVVSSHWIQLDGVDCGGAQRSVLLADGSVWRWGRYDCAIGFVAFLGLVVVAGAAMSLALSLLVAFHRPPIGWPKASGAAP